MKQPAPIALFVYNRPDHTARTIDALKLNHLASESDLFIFSDGPRVDADEKTVKAIRELRLMVKGIEGFKSVTVYEGSTNSGLAESIIKGVTRIVNKFGRVIVVEDDILTSRGFLSFMNESLDLYQDDPKVMQVSGFMIPNKKLGKGTYLYRAPGSWGWATWADRWEKFVYNNEDISLLIKEIDTYYFNVNGSYDYMDQLVKNLSGEINTWAVKWYLTMYLNKGLCLLPSKSLTRNIGFDGSGENCEDNNSYSKHKMATSIKLKKKAKLEEDPACLNLFITYYENKYRLDRITRIKIYLRRIFNYLTKKDGTI